MAAYGVVPWPFLTEIVGASLSLSHRPLDAPASTTSAAHRSDRSGWTRPPLIAIGLAAATTSRAEPLSETESGPASHPRQLAASAAHRRAGRRTGSPGPAGAVPAGSAPQRPHQCHDDLVAERAADNDRDSIPPATLMGVWRPPGAALVRTYVARISPLRSAVTAHTG